MSSGPCGRIRTFHHGNTESTEFSFFIFLFPIEAENDLASFSQALLLRLFSVSSVPPW